MRPEFLNFKEKSNLKNVTLSKYVTTDNDFEICKKLINEKIIETFGNFSI